MRDHRRSCRHTGTCSSGGTSPETRSGPVACGGDIGVKSTDGEQLWKPCEYGSLRTATFLLPALSLSQQLQNKLTLSESLEQQWSHHCYPNSSYNRTDSGIDMDSIVPARAAATGTDLSLERTDRACWRAGTTV